MNTPEQTRYVEWIGRSRSTTELITPAPLHALAALLDHPTPELVVPPLWHWAYFLSPHRMADTGHDGHSRLDDFMPPTPLPRRMRAGGGFSFSKLLEVGERAERVSNIDGVQTKTGASGQLVFVTVRHEITGNRGARISETESIVYREEPKPGSKAATRHSFDLTPQFTRTVSPDPVLLFKYSAVTQNAHRIHYDRPYAMDQEGYPGLVVHGPLSATLLLDLLTEHAPTAVVTDYRYTAMGPLFDTDSFQLCGRIDGSTATLWAVNNRGELAMKAKASLSSDRNPLP